jgi:hypothetical protein
MSRNNKVNPGQYTQRGRLTPDDSARELVRQRTAIASQDKHQGRPGVGPWQGATKSPVNDDNEQRAGREEEVSAPGGKPRNTARTAAKTSGGSKSAGGPKKPEKQAMRSAAKTPKKTAAKRSAAKSGGASGRPPARKAALARGAVKRKKTARR